jgi:hypothetical protein
MFYAQVRQNASRLTRLVVTLLPLMVLLVGSCKTEQASSAYVGNESQQIRMALFPTQTGSPAAGYVSRARSFIVGQPQSLMMLTQQEIGYLFGKPTLHRKDADAEVWQYKTSGCVVDFYFYNDEKTHGQVNPSYVDMRMKDELTPGSAPRSTPASSSEKSNCLQGAMSEGHSVSA